MEQNLFEKIKKGLNKGIDTIGTKSKEFMDANKVKGDILDLKRKKVNIFEEIGQNAYTMFKANNFIENELKEKYLEIDEIIKQIEQKEEKLKQIHENAKNKLVNEQEENKTLCSKCSSEIEKDTKFCGNCGEKIQ